MPPIQNPQPVPTVTANVIIPLSQIDRAPAPVAVTQDPGLQPAGTVPAPVLPVSEQPVSTSNVAAQTNIVVSQPSYLAVDDEGTLVLAKTTVLNFTGNGVTVTASGSTAQVNVTAGAGNYSNANVVALMASFGSNSISTTGNVTANYVLGNGSQLTGLPATYGNANVTTLLSGFGSNSISTTGNVTAATVNGNIQAPDGNGSILINRSGVIGAAAGFSYDQSANAMFVPTITASGLANTGVDAFYGGLGSYTVLGSSVIVQLTSNVNAYSQINQQNISSGNLASADYIITADNGTDSSYYLDIGLASSTHNDPNFFGDTGTNNDAYMYVTAADQAGPSVSTGPGNLIVGSTNGVIKLFVGNTAQANVIATVASDGISVTGNIVGVTANNNGYMQWVGNSSGDGIGFTTMQLVPDITLGSEQRIIVDPTGPNHIHLRAGGTQDNSAAQLYLGGENSHFKVDNGLNPNVYATANSYKWTFGSDGNFTLPGDNVSTAFSRITSLANSSGDGAGYTTLGLIPDINLTGSDQYLIIDPTAPGHIHIRAGGTQDDSTADLFLGGENSYFRVAAGANSQVQVTSNSNTWVFNTDGNLQVPGNINGDNSAPLVIDGAASGEGYISLPNTSFGNEQLVIVNKFMSGNGIRLETNGGNLFFTDSANLSVTGNVTGNYFIGNGSQLTGITATTLSNGNSNVAIATANGNVAVTAAGIYTWTFGDDGNLTLPGGYTIGEPGGPTLKVSAPSSTDAIQLNWANEVSLTLGNTGAANIAQIGTAGGYWNFDQNALLNLPGGNVAIGLQYGTEAILATNTDFGVATQGNGTTFLNWSDDVANTSVLSAIYVNAPGSVTGNIQVRTGNVGSPNSWTFVTTGNLELPSEGNIVGITANNTGHLRWVGNSSGDGSGYTTLQLVPDNTTAGGDQYLIIDPTGGGHIHLRAGGTQDASNAILFIGGENSYVSIGSNNNPPVTIAANNYSWSFGTDSQFSAAGNIYTLGEVRSGSTVTPPLPLANLTATAGSRAFASDANLVAAGNFGQQVTGGAGNTVPVWSDGTNWYIG